MKKIILTCFTVLAGLIFTLNSCKHDPVAPIVPVEEICFQSQILPLIQGGCATSDCHDGSGEEFALTDYSSISNRVTAGDPANSSLYEVLIANPGSDKFMPPSPAAPFTAAQKALIYGWISQGAKNTTCTSGCDTNVFTFSGAVWPINQQYCLSCHSGGSPSGGVGLNNYAEIVNAVNTRNLYGTISGSGITMPPTGLMEACKIRQIKKWIDAGKLNN